MTAQDLVMTLLSEKGWQIVYDDTVRNEDESLRIRFVDFQMVLFERNKVNSLWNVWTTIGRHSCGSMSVHEDAKEILSRVLYYEEKR